MPSNHLILCHPFLLLPSILPSIRVFSNELVLCIRWPKYWSFSFSISPSKEQPVLISFRMDWLDLLAVQGTLKSLLQHHSSKASILRRSAFFIVQLSHSQVSSAAKGISRGRDGWCKNPEAGSSCACSRNWKEKRPEQIGGGRNVVAALTRQEVGTRFQVASETLKVTLDLISIIDGKPLQSLKAGAWVLRPVTCLFKGSCVWLL